MTAVPDYLPMLIKGKSVDPQQGGCLVQIANWLTDPTSWTDEAVCVDQFLAIEAVICNDGVSDPARHKLALLAPRLAGTNLNHDVGLREAVHEGLRNWRYKGAGSGYPWYLHPSSNFTPTPNGYVQTIKLSEYVLVHDEAYAIAWLTAMIDEYDRLAGRETIPALPVEKWLEIKELVGQ